MAWSEVWLRQGVHGLLGFFSFMVFALVPRYPIEFDAKTFTGFLFSFHLISMHDWRYKGNILVPPLLYHMCRLLHRLRLAIICNAVKPNAFSC